ncbi:hypothetical protein R5R35_011504 [Gryllus longicercus]|uniref:SH3 domain-containing protein n=1 Tax=Gryllus longicercus TaxID=2509291 RepID=A0AAN9VQ57_9ORTH
MVETNRLEAMVEFEYIAQEQDELTIHKGDIIKDIKTQPGGWWEGTLGDKRGMFPDNFVRVLADSTKHNASPPVTLRTVSGRRCKVLFSYQPVNEDELQLEVNDVIDIIGEVEEGWWKGKLRDAVGVFPSNFVTEISDCPADSSSQASGSSHKRNSRVLCDSDNRPSLSSDSSQAEAGKTGEDNDAPVLPPKPVKEMCRVLFPYEAANKDELTLKEGDIIMILSKEVADKGWWKGELRGRVGVFPDNFVEIIQEEVSKKPERPPSKSQLSTTNRIRDTITKPSAPSTCKSEPADVVANRKSQDEKPPFPPVPGKKPQLPPPIKKPQRIAVSPGSVPGGVKHQDHEPSLSDLVDGIGSSRIAQSSNYGVPKGNREEVPEFDNVERSAMLNHPTASRVKAPRRRLPTNVHSRESETPVGLMNGSALGSSQEEDLIMKNNGIPSRLWENKSKAPWMEELKMNQAKKSGPLKSPSSISSIHSSSIPDQPSVPETLPISSTARHSISGEINIPGVSDISLKSSLSGGGKIKKDISSDRQQTPHVNESSGALTKSHSLSSSIVLGSEEVSDMNQAHQNLKSSMKSVIHPPVMSSSNVPPKAEGAVGDSSASPALSHSHGTTIPSIQYLELMDKIVKLEKSLEQQRATFTQAIKEVTEKLNEERNRRTHLEQELDKLTNLVTQV